MRRTLLVAAVALLATPAVAGATDSLTLLSDPGDFLGQGQPLLLHDGNAGIHLDTTARGVRITALEGPGIDEYNVLFDVPLGQVLREGRYPKATSGWREGLPELDVTVAARGCDGQGQFEVLDIERDLMGEVRRFHAVFEYHCGVDVPAVFGEVRIGQPEETSPAVALPRLLRWPDTDLGAKGSEVPVRVLATGALPVQFSDAWVEGEDAAVFPIRSDGCSGTTVQPGQSCPVLLHLASPTPGLRRGKLVVIDTSGNRYETALEGWVLDSRSRWEMESDRGDLVGAGRAWSYSPANGHITASGTRTHVKLSVNGSDGTYWTADFVPPDGHTLVPGHYARAKRYPFNGAEPGLDVGGEGRGCGHVDGSFTVTEATYDADGFVDSFGVSFRQECADTDAALRGALEFRVDTRTTPAAVPMSTQQPPPDNPPAPAPGDSSSPVEPSTPAPATTPPPLSTAPVPRPSGVGAPQPAPALFPQPAKLQVERARIREGRLDVLARITRRAQGELAVSYRAAGGTVRFPARIDDGLVRVDRRLRGAQRRLSTGIVTLEYAGTGRVRADRVRLRAASRPARLRRGVARISDGRLQVAGTISQRARGVVRVRMGFETEKGVGFAHFRAPIRNGRWALDEALTGPARRGGQLSIQYTGDFARRLRGEQDAKQVRAS